MTLLVFLGDLILLNNSEAMFFLHHHIRIRYKEMISIFITKCGITNLKHPVCETWQRFLNTSGKDQIRP